ncbi:MAG: tetratricopeptide repeat protein [Cyanobacteria bacterium REEB67]|nr:tetratricopeptide repeat protein [Cyanobacteria bacterium REEB67]
MYTSIPALADTGEAAGESSNSAPAAAVKTDANISGESFVQIVKRANEAFNGAHFEQAKNFYEEAFAVGKKGGANKPDLAVILSDIAMIEKLNFHYEQAQDCLEDALPMAGDDEPLVALLHTRLSSVCRARGNLHGALEHAKESLTIRRKLDPKNAQVAESLNNVAVLSLDLKNAAEAIDYCDQAQAAVIAAGKAGGAEESAVLSTKAAALSEEHKYDQAKDILAVVLLNQEKLFGANSPKLAVTLNNLAMTYSKRKQYVEAEPYLKRSLQVTEAGKPQDIAGAADASANLAGLYAHMGNKQAAENYYRKAIEFSKSINYRHLADFQEEYQRFVAASKGFIEPD